MTKEESTMMHSRVEQVKTRAAGRLDATHELPPRRTPGRCRRLDGLHDDAGATEVGSGRSQVLWLLGVLIALSVLVSGCGTGDDSSQEGAAAGSQDAAEEDTAEEDATDGDATTEAADKSGPADPADEVSALAEEVGDVRGLSPQGDVAAELVTQDELGSLAREQAERQERIAVVDQKVLAALRLVPEDTDLADLVEESMAAGAEGVYDPAAEELYVAADEWPLSPSQQAIAAHEVAHALQDQHFDLTRMQDLLKQDVDAADALRYVVEGDALAAQQSWARTHLSAQQRQEYQRQRMAKNRQNKQAMAEADIPEAMMLDLSLPYVVGNQFVQTLREQAGQQAVDAALQDPPVTTVEVYDPQLYLDGFQPRDVDGLARPGGEWAEHATTRFGGHMVALLQPLKQAMQQARQGELATASAWRGGQLRAWRDGDDLAVGVATTFADDAAAAFCDRVKAWYRQQADAEPVGDGVWESPRDAMALDCGDRDVAVGIAPTVEAAQAVIDS
jgi:hypothetical protein